MLKLYNRVMVPGKNCDKMLMASRQDFATLLMAKYQSPTASAKRTLSKRARGGMGAVLVQY